jgi:copper chaperone CopZ
MTCNHCVMRVAKALKGTSGVQDAQVDLQKGQAVVTYDDAKVSRDNLSFAVVEAGYKVV